ncbi:TolC family protein [Pseudoalteromonas denitrificans]|uniref:Outer membrane protein TolC n=1 Tax=Pseudoalteromonas denitrificans DSM 6059 TaxID=1123010 RepID=A0A1I1FMR5_9GAMM|nr:TolC family protein [Pseudoalteromonas denitrificans]SFB98320.1 Outer membrane protein TolC [Pseudoalteromonas denitrificans DSM 6059]
MNLKSSITCLLGVLLPAFIVIKSASADENKTISQQIWFENQVMLHPIMISAKERLNMQLYLANSTTQALYNPELTSSYEREGKENNYSAGLNQTFDIWDKRAVLTDQAKFKRIFAEQEYAQKYQETLADAFVALIEYQSASQTLVLIHEQEKQMFDLINEVKKRQKVNELSELDLQVSLSSISIKLKETALASVQLFNAKANIMAMLPSWNETININVEVLLNNKDLNVNMPNEQAILTLPNVKKAYVKTKIDKYQTQLTKLLSKADPTVGFTTGKTANENKFGVNFTLPLNIRNNYSDEVKASSNALLVSNANYAAIILKTTSQIKAAKSIMQQYITQVKLWEGLAGDSVQRSLDLIQNKWNAGDMSTTEYLLILQQRIEGLTAAISLKKQAKLATIEYLKLTAQLG